MEDARPASLKVSTLTAEQVEFGVTEGAVEADDAALNRRYVEEGVRIVVEQARYPLNQIFGMFNDTYETDTGEREYKYKRDPEYQRRHRWGPERQSRLIESFLLNVPVPPVFLYEYDLARFEVMDGRQRLTALMEFYDDKLVLAGLQHWPELNGRRYTTLPSSIRDGIDRRYLSSIILLNETAATPEKAAALKKLVFERLNSGGVRLSGQETRNAVYNGPLNDLCMELSRTELFRRILGTPEASTLAPSSIGSDDALISTDDLDDYGEPLEEVPSDDGVVVTKLGQKMYESMEDVEVVLRFFAYRHLQQYSQGLNRITEFLDEFLIIGNTFDDSVLDAYRALFTENIEFWYTVGGADAFQGPGSRSRRFSKITFDALMYSSSALSPEQRAELLGRPESVQAELATMYDTDAEVFGGRKTNTSDARRRNQLALSALERALTSVP